MKEKHTIKNPLRKLSLQWRLTLIITLLMTVTCIKIDSPDPIIDMQRPE